MRRVCLVFLVLLSGCMSDYERSHAKAEAWFACAGDLPNSELCR